MSTSNTINKAISSSRFLHRNPYALVNDQGDFDAVDINPETSHVRNALENPYALLNSQGNFDTLVSNKSQKPKKQIPRTDDDIEAAARDLQKNLWKRRHELFPDRSLIDPIELLNPGIAIELFGYHYIESEYIGEYYSHNPSTDTAGIINNDTKTVEISTRHPLIEQRFTGAHELGHLILHDNMGSMHRDKPADRSSNKHRSAKEREADKFATFFTMPKNLVKSRFKAIFGCSKFQLNENTAFALDHKNNSVLIHKYNTKRKLSRALAAATHYNGTHFQSLASQFHVSNEAMAIRLEELDLV